MNKKQRLEQLRVDKERHRKEVQRRKNRAKKEIAHYDHKIQLADQ